MNIFTIPKITKYVVIIIIIIIWAGSCLLFGQSNGVLLHHISVQHEHLRLVQLSPSYT